MDTSTLIYIYFVIALLISKIPYVNVYFSLLNTLLHEVFHVVCAVMFSGKIRHKIRLERDASGLAITNLTSRVPKTLVYIAGYTGSSIAAFILFYFIHLGMFKMILYIFFILVLISLLLWIRNLYGVCWALSIISLLLFIIYLQNKVIIMHTSIFLSAVVLIQSIFSAFTVFKLSLTKRKHAGDATSLANETFIPAVVWGLLFFSQALFFAYFIVKNFLI